MLSAEEGERGTLTLTFDLPPSPLLALSPALLLAFETPPTGEIPDVTFTSQSLHPHAQVQVIHEGKSVPEVPQSVAHDLISDIAVCFFSPSSSLDGVHLGRNAVRPADGKGSRGKRSPGMEDFRWHEIPRYE